jgi:hypothetical protein
MFVDPSHNRFTLYNNFGGVYRPYGTFYEPSVLGAYAAFSFIYFTVADKNYKILSRMAAVLVIMSLSMTGVMIMVGYLMLIFFGYLLDIVDRLVLSKKMLKSIILLTIAFFSGLTLLSYFGFMNKIGERVSTVINILVDLSAAGSTGSRLLGGLYTIGALYDVKGISGLLFGVGYGAQNSFISSFFNQSFSYYSPAQSGNLYDKISLVMISSGLIGLSLLLMVYYSVFSKYMRGNVVFHIYIFMSWCFVSGQLVGYLDWQYLFLMLAAFILNERNCLGRVTARS